MYSFRICSYNKKKNSDNNYKTIVATILANSIQGWPNKALI